MASSHVSKGFSHYPGGRRSHVAGGGGAAALNQPRCEKPVIRKILRMQLELVGC